MKYRDQSRRHFIISQPTKSSSIDFDQLYDDISRDWRKRARNLQERRWREINEREI